MEAHSKNKPSIVDYQVDDEDAPEPEFEPKGRRFSCWCSCGAQYVSEANAELNPTPRLVTKSPCPSCASRESVVGLTTLDARGWLATRRDVSTGMRFHDFSLCNEFVCELATPVNLHIHEQLILSSGTGFGDLPVLVLEGGERG